MQFLVRAVAMLLPVNCHYMQILHGKKRSQQMTKQYTYSRGSHLYVDFWSGVKIFDRQEVCLIAWLSLLKLIFYGSNIRMQLSILDFCSSEVTLIPWSALKRALITWFNSDLGRKHFYTGHINDNPLILKCFSSIRKCFSSIRKCFSTT